MSDTSAAFAGNYGSGRLVIDADGEPVDFEKLPRRTRRSLRPVVALANVERQNRPDARPSSDQRARRVRRNRRAVRDARRASR